MQRVDGSYFLSVDEIPRPAGSEGANQDLPGDTTTTGEIAVGASVVGRFDSSKSDVDWYKVTLAAGKTYEFDLDVPGEGQLTDGGGTLDLYDSTGMLPGVAGETASQQAGNQLFYFVPTAGTYYVGVTGTADSAGLDYTISVDEI